MRPFRCRPDGILAATAGANRGTWEGITKNYIYQCFDSEGLFADGLALAANRGHCFRSTIKFPVWLGGGAS